ncbi:hypothetical protein [Limnoglobus roseus]|uniref:ThuA-like domain-containing protein n=1 Tax=Limnoglobus roseus TaxID=2598579 RepID=A0A5C1AFY4_9BACT|nr:hypothetical protein [Limnoglobus roseus]QEL17133.1 hypothetical protein PX52LOC_04114 [Limnoglobus roseus]
MSARFTRGSLVARALAILVTMTSSATSAAPVPKGLPPKVVVGFGFRGEEKDADPFRKLLADSEGFTVELIALEAVTQADLKKYGLIIFGADAKTEEWAGIATAIDRAGKPVLALGEGGYDFLGRPGLKLDIGAPQGWHGEETGVIPVGAAESRLWIAAGIRTDKPVSLYKRSGHVGIIPAKTAAGVVLLGREEADAEHYPIIGQGDRVLWGFTGGPADMTDAGRKVFVATCRYTAKLTRPAAKEEK